MHFKADYERDLLTVLSKACEEAAVWPDTAGLMVSRPIRFYLNREYRPVTG